MPPRLPPASAIRKSTAPPQPPMNFSKATRGEARPYQAYQWAQDHGGPADEPGYFNLDHAAEGGKNDPDGGQATMSIITPRELLSGLYYGDRADEAIDAMKLTGRRAQSMDRPIAHVHRPDVRVGTYFSTPSDSISPSVWDGRRTIFTGGNYSNYNKLDPQFVTGHEGGHAVNDERFTEKLMQEPYSSTNATSMASSMEQAGVDPDMGRWMQVNGPYYHKNEELAAQANVAKGLHYGVTGQIPKTDQDFEELIRGFMGHDYQLHPGAPTLFETFGEDPIMQYGPRAGEKATGKAFLDALMKSLLNPDNKATSRDVKDAAKFFRSSDANSNRAAGTV